MIELMLPVFLLALCWTCSGDPLYALVIDAGSTSTKAFVYTWDDNCGGTAGECLSDVSVLVNERWSPGISYYAGNDAGLIAYFKPIINWANANVPDEKAPVYFGATAGMRLLSVAQSTAIMQRLRQMLETFTFFDLGSDVERSVKILSGEEEGVYGWITVNHYLDNTYPKDGTAVALDLGGASTQVTFEPTEEILANKWSIVVPTARTVDVYTRSFFKYGQNEFYELSKQQLTLSHPVGDIPHPCLFSGYNVTDYGRTFVGTSDVVGCKAHILDMMQLNSFCFFQQCTVDAEFFPSIPPAMDVYAFAGFYFPVDELSVDPTDPSFTLAHVMGAADALCTRSWGWATDPANSINSDPPFLDTLCVRAYHMLLLLNEAYGLALTRQRVHIVQDINGNAISWNLGMLLHEETELLLRRGVYAAEGLAYQVSTVIFGVSTGILGFAIVFCAIVIVILIRQHPEAVRKRRDRRFKRRGWGNLPTDEPTRLKKVQGRLYK